MAKFKFLHFITVMLFIACDLSQSQQAKPENVYRIVYDWRSNEWYQKQAELWKKELERDPSNPEAWHNYYNANRYAHFEDIDTEEKRALLNKIIEDMGKAIPGTYEYYLLKYWNTYDIHDMSLIEKAYQLRPDKPETYYPFITHYEMKHNKEKMTEFCKKLYDSKDIAPWLLSYNYNVLVSTDSDGILFTNGDNDTYPAWILQNSLGIRSDVTILNVSLLPTDDYLEKKLNKKGILIDTKALKQKVQAAENHLSGRLFKSKFVQELSKELLEKYPKIPIYFALTISPEKVKNIRDELYIVGLAYQYSKRRIDNIALIKKNMEHNFRLDYLEHDWYQEQYSGNINKQKMHMNYVIPMVMLADHYQMSGDSRRSEEWNKRALQLAEEAGNVEALEDIRKEEYKLLDY
jgi:hypothetical protein